MDSKNLLDLATRDITSSKHLAVWDWFYACPLFEYLYFAFSSAENGDVIITPDDVISPTSTTADNVLQGFIDGSIEKEYIFFVSVILPFEKEANKASVENINFMNIVEGIAEWTSEQNNLGNFPIFGEQYQINSIETLPSGEAISGADDTGAKYQFSIRITYRDNSTKRSI